MKTIVALLATLAIAAAFIYVGTPYIMLHATAPASPTWTLWLTTETWEGRATAFQDASTKFETQQVQTRLDLSTCEIVQGMEVGKIHDRIQKSANVWSGAATNSHGGWYWGNKLKWERFTVLQTAVCLATGERPKMFNELKAADPHAAERITTASSRIR